MNRTCITLLFILVNVVFAYAQDTTATNQLIFFTSQKQKGIYRTFKEFRNNKPSIPYQGTVEEKKEIVNIFDEPNVAYKLNFGDSLPCAKKTPIWGFCDGNTIYISRSPKFGKKNIYDKIIFLGRYIYYTSVETSYGGGAPVMMGPMVGGGGMMMGGGGGRTKVVVEYMINANTGWQEQLTKEVVRELIAEDQELSLAFKEEKRKRKVLGEYVMKYAVKHHDEIKK